MADARIFQDLKADHDRHRAMFAAFEQAQDDDRKARFEALRTELQAHAAAEEESLYATMLGCPELRDDARHSVSEHKEIDDFLGKLVQTDMSSPEWAETFAKLQHRYLHHIEEEEEEMFPEAARTLSDEAERRLAQVFEARKPKELAMAKDDKPGDERD